MATVQYYDDLPEYEWAGNLLRGGEVTKVSATSIQYVSDGGFKVTVSGTGFAYNSEGRPIRGDVTKISVSNAEGKVMDITGLAAKLPVLFNFAFGYEREGEGVQQPDDTAIFSYLLRGNDTINGSNNGDDIIAGRNPGNDIVNGRGGNDYIKGDAGVFQYDGGAGDGDTLSFRETYYDQTAYRGIKLDATKGTVTDSWGDSDTFKNFEGYADSVFDDVMTGSSRNERFELSQGDDTVNGGGGFDRVSYRDAHRDGGKGGITANLTTGDITDAWGNTDTVSNVEAVFGTQKADKFTGDAKDNMFQGFKGKDNFNGAGGSDTVVFWDNENLGAKVGIDVDLRLTSGQIKNDGFGNTETTKSIENIEGSSLADLIHGSDATNALRGDSGNDKIYGNGGEDFLEGNDGADQISGGSGNDHIDGNAGKDKLTGGSGEDDFNFAHLGTKNADTITDFQTGIDQIWLDPGAFKGGLASGELKLAQFKAGAGLTAATTDAQRVLYDTETGKLYFDADGKGGADAVEFATLSNIPTIKFSDFEVF